MHWCLFVASLAAMLALNDDAGHPRYERVGSWPEFRGKTSLGQVSGVAADSHGHIFVFHRNGQSWGSGKGWKPITAPTVLCLDPVSGEILKAWGTGQFVMPHGLRIDEHDNIWITDVGLHQVFQFSHDGRPLLTLGEAQHPGNDTAHFNKPTDVAFGPDGSIYVSDGYGNSRVARFTRLGKFVSAWGKAGTSRGQFNLPHSIAVDDQGLVYVADRENHRIQIFKADGTFVALWPREKVGYPFAVTIRGGAVYVLDRGEGEIGIGRVIQFDLRGNELASWGEPGSSTDPIACGHALAIGQDASVYVGGTCASFPLWKYAPINSAPMSAAPL